ncbi:UNVERIFIED_CONTAM: hypothetical protein GTU68_059836 [Idotea baltica]|nr:hypothetical protein [Idotea baltica]
MPVKARQGSTCVLASIKNCWCRLGIRT